MTDKPKHPTRALVLWSIGGIFLLVVANSAWFISRNFFNEQKFSQIVTTAVLSESSRQAFATEIVDQVLAKRPVLKEIVDDSAVSLISGLLGTSRANQAVQKTVAKLNTVITSKDPQSVTFDLTRIKSISSKLIGLATAAGREVSLDPNDLPDQIVIIDASKIPPLYNYGLAFLWLAPICFVAGLACLAWPHFKAKAVRPATILIQALAVVGGTLVALLTGPLLRPPVLAASSDQNLRAVIGNVYDAFITGFNQQTIWCAGILLIALGLAGLIWRWRRTISGWLHPSSKSTT